jgi:hypothetical protein
MSVINRLEIANFLNLDQVLPHQQGWTTHYPHLVLNFRGQSAAVVATNGIGKSTINRAVYALLTRDHEFMRITKSVSAPKRSGVFTHFRLEVLYRDRPVGALLGEMGAQIPGEPYVIGFYGNADTELVFYSYHGHLEDCPCARRLGTKIRIESNQAFRERLKLQNECRHNPPREEWRDLIGKHFELAMLAQLVAYQKAGGGDSAEEFFKVKQRRIDGQTDEYDASFFYEHIAPEVLANAMRGFGKEGETHFEDTILESASPLIRAELQNERLAAALERDRTTFAALENAQNDLRDFIGARQRLDNEVADLAAEVGFLLDVVERRPLPGIPPVLLERAESTRGVANRLVLQDGSWQIPDALLGEIWGSNAGNVNLEGTRRGISSSMLGRREVIEIPCNNIFEVKARGSIGRAYSIEDAVALTEGRTTFAPGWTRDEALRAIRYGFEYRVMDGDTNPFRRHKLALRREHDEAEADRDATRAARVQIKAQHDDIVGRIGSLRADEHELSLIRQSGLFTETEIDDLEATAHAVEDNAVRSRQAREAHEHRYIQLTEARSAHDECRLEFPDVPVPNEALADLEGAREAAAEAAEAARQASEAAADEAHAAEETRKHAEEKLSACQEEHFSLKALLQPVERFETAFPGEMPIGLAEQVQAEHDRAMNRLASIEQREATLAAERDALLKLAPSYAECRALFPLDALQGLEAEIVNALRQGLERRTALQTDGIPSAMDRAKRLTEEHEIMLQVGATVGEEVAGLETRLRDRYRKATHELQDLRPSLTTASEDAAAMDVFATAFGTHAEPRAVRRQRQSEAEQTAALMSDAAARQSDLKRQLDELTRAATAAGKIANEVLEKVGKESLRVYQVVEQELGGSPRRSALLTHFSHVLHAPVARDDEEAWMMLTALDEAGIEAPVFWLDCLRQFCRAGAISSSQHVTVGTLAGQPTLQVQGLIDPAKVEHTRRRIEQDLEATEQVIGALERTRADLDPTSERSVIVSRACEAADRNVFSQLPELRSRAGSLEATIERLNRLLAEPFVALMRTAEEFLAAGGKAALNEAKSHLEAVEAELTGIEAALPDLEKRASPTSIQLIRGALRFEHAGGRARLDDVAAEMEMIVSERGNLEEKLPRLTARRDAIPDIKAAAEFAQCGGRATLKAQLETIAELVEARERAVNAAKAALLSVTTTSAAAQTASREAARTGERLSTWRRVLKAAQSYLDSDGIAFDATYEEHLERLRKVEKSQQQRTTFRFAMAANARKAEREGLGVTALNKQRVDLANALDDKDQRVNELDALIEKLTQQIAGAEAHARRIDKAVVSLIDAWKQARQAIADVDLSSETLAAAPSNKAVKAARANVNSLRALATEAGEAPVLALEEAESDVRRFALSGRIPSIKDARDRKDSTWRMYQKDVEALRKNRTLSLSDTDRALLEDALTPGGVRHVGEMFTAFEQHLGRQTNLYEQAKQDIEDQRTKLSESLEAFTLNVGDNFRLLKNCLKPSNDATDAGFEIEADIIERHGIRAAVDKVIALIKMQEEQRHERLAKQTDAESQREYERRIKEEIRRIFYRAVFIGSAKEPGSSPRIFLRHPRIGGGRRLRMDRKVSTGQANALALLLLTKLADYAISRDERALLATAGRRRGIIHSTRVVMIDGLFSNVSNRRLIRQSLDAMRGLKGKFQLIGWIHNEAYENDPEIFPEHLGIRRIGDGEGFVMVEDASAVGQTAEFPKEAIDLGPGSVSVLELHADVLTERAPL